MKRRRYNKHSSDVPESDQEILPEQTIEKKRQRKKHQSRSQSSKSKSSYTLKSSNKKNLNEDSDDDHTESDSSSDKEEFTRNRDQTHNLNNSTPENNDTDVNETFLDLDSTGIGNDHSSDNEENVLRNNLSYESTGKVSRDNLKRERKRKEQEMLLNSIVKTAVSTALEKVSVHLSTSVSSQSPAISRSETRNVSLPKWDKNDKLRNRKQWKMWKRKVELDLKGHHLYECILYKDGKESWDEEMRTSKMALAQSYLDDAVCKSIEVSQINSPSPFDTYSELVKQYGPNEIFDNIELWKKIKNIKFKMGYSQQRYVNDIKSICTEAALANMPFSDSMKRTIFLGEMEGIEETGHPLQVFYGNMATQPKENKTFEYVCSQFLNYSLPQVAKDAKNSTSESSSNAARKFEKKGNGNYQGRSFQQGNNPKRAGNESGYGNTSNKRFRTGAQSSLNKLSSTNESKSQNSDKKIVHPKSDKPDGSYFIDGVLVIPGKRPDYGKEGNERIRNMTEEERRANKCKKCGQYLHAESNCPNPGPQCYGCSNFGHVTPKCPFAKRN